MARWLCAIWPCVVPRAEVKPIPSYAYAMRGTDGKGHVAVWAHRRASLELLEYSIKRDKEFKESSGAGMRTERLRPVSYTHLTLPTICSV
eukprot:3934845-Rhodomonas_salina.1